MMGPIQPSGLPAPAPEGGYETSAFWTATAEQSLLVGHCGCCQQWSWPPTRSFCPHCGHRGIDLVPSSGRGGVYSYTLVHRSVGTYSDAVPYYLAYVLLDEGVTMMSNLVGVDEIEVAVNMRVRVVFEPTASKAMLPRFRPE